MSVISRNLILHAHACLCIHESTMSSKITFVQKCLKQTKKKSRFGHPLCADQEHSTGWMHISKCVFSVCRNFGHSRAPIHCMAHALLLHMNKLILPIEHCLLHVHTAPWEAPSHTTSLKKCKSRHRHSSVSCTLPPVCRGYDRSAR